MSSQKIHTTKPVMILLYGFPGAGKTHFARNLTESLASAHVQSDRIRYELFEEPRFDKQENGIVNHLMDYMTEEFLRSGVSVIFDTDVSRKATRKRIREKALKKKAETLVVWFQVDPETSYKRLGKRDKRKADDKYAREFSQEEFRQLASKMQHPEERENYVVVSGKHTFASQKAAFMQKLIELGLVDRNAAKGNVAKPGLINLIPKTHGRFDQGRRNINIR